MKLTSYTGTDDYNIRTLFSMMADRDYWTAGVDWKDWRLIWTYTWYDGPIWQLIVGPFWVSVACVNVPRAR